MSLYNAGFLGQDLVVIMNRIPSFITLEYNDRIYQMLAKRYYCDSTKKVDFQVHPKIHLRSPEAEKWFLTEINDLNSISYIRISSKYLQIDLQFFVFKCRPKPGQN